MIFFTIQRAKPNSIDRSYYPICIAWDMNNYIQFKDHMKYWRIHNHNYDQLEIKASCVHKIYGSSNWKIMEYHRWDRPWPETK
jgi:hypothetical protein